GELHTIRPDCNRCYNAGGFYCIVNVLVTGAFGCVGTGEESLMRRILLVYPRFARNNLLNYENMAPLYPGRRAVMPPLGLLLFGGRLRDYDLRLVDENVNPLQQTDLEWADVVAISAMHPQRRRVHEIVKKANRMG